MDLGGEWLGGGVDWIRLSAVMKPSGSCVTELVS
jgi:hypothetical protein